LFPRHRRGRNCDFTLSADVLHDRQDVGVKPQGTT
jgi:hypothetical protein